MQRANQHISPPVDQYVHSAKTHLRDGNPGAALADIDLAFLAAPENPAVRLLRGRALSTLGRTEAALVELNGATALDPNLAEAWLERSAIHLGRSDWRAAEADATRALELDPELPGGWSTRGIARYRLGLPREAAEDLNECLIRERDDPSVHYWRGLVLRDMGDNHAAVTEFDAAIRLNDRYAEAYVARGKAYSNLDNMVAARSDWAIAAQMLHHSH